MALAARTARVDKECLLKGDIAAEFHFYFESGDLKGHFGGKRFCSRDGVRRDSLGNRMFDLPLGVNADGF